MFDVKDNMPKETTKYVDEEKSYKKMKHKKHFW